jgi:hypothetical protein
LSECTSADEKILLEQYNEASQMQRKLLELFWQEPSVIVAIAGAVVVASYSYITDKMVVDSVQYQLLRLFLVLFGTAMSWASAQTAIKHRFYRILLLERIRSMERALGLMPLPLSRHDLHPRGKNRIWEKVSAELMLIGCLLFLTVGFAVLSGYNVYCLVT